MGKVRSAGFDATTGLETPGIACSEVGFFIGLACGNSASILTRLGNIQVYTLAADAGSSGRMPGKSGEAG
jgi:hypothetical protein